MSGIRYPEQGEVLGIVFERLGGSRFRVRCQDGAERMCRLCGKLRNRCEVRGNDVVLIKPWPVQSNERGDVIWRYFPYAADQLRREGILTIR